GSPLPPLRILMAEDSLDNSVILLAYLEDTPYRIDVAETGLRACQMFQEGRYDLVLMDRQMPVMDGLTATRTIRAWEIENGRPPTPIIALTASALKGDRETCLAAGCTAYLTKPIKQEVLLQAIKDHSVVGPASEAKERGRADAASHPMDPRFRDLIPKYLENCRRDFVTMLTALAIGDFEKIAFIAHQMKGSGGAFGFQALSDMGDVLEHAAEAADLDLSRKAVADFGEYLDGVRLALDS
ncbi:MAG: response regulator, partial [Nitrospiraceae bacterium]|nr:response regulator [Nitrospiraceae bacterium]